MSTQPLNILFPPGRIVQGDLYKPQDKDQDGNPLLTKSGPNAGKPRLNYYYAHAIQKTRAVWWEETHTLADGTQSMWGSKILQFAYAAWPRGQAQQPGFAFKIDDGDSAVPKGKNMIANKDREGFPGCWIVRFSSSFPPKIFDSNGNPLVEEGLVKPGFWIETWGSVSSNESEAKPGLYMNHSMVSFRGRDKEIVTGPDPRAVGFGKAAVPAHVTMAPAPGANMPAPSSGLPPPAGAAAQAGYPATPGLPAAPGGYPAMPGAVTPPAATAAIPPPAAPVAVAPHPGFIAPPVAGAAPPPPAAAPALPAAAAPPAAASMSDPLGAPAGYRMANPAGARYEAYRQQGWTDAQLISNGAMVRL